MRYVVTIFWALVLGQVVGFLGGALSKTPYDFVTTAIVSFVAAILILAIAEISTPHKPATHK